MRRPPELGWIPHPYSYEVLTEVRASSGSSRGVGVVMMPYVRAVTTALRECLIALVAAVTVLAVTPAAHAQSCSSNPICVENQQNGTPQERLGHQRRRRRAEKIQGFASEMSVNRGSTISFKVKNTATSYKIDIYRIGYYGGDGARLDPGQPHEVRGPGSDQPHAAQLHDVPHRQDGPDRLRQLGRLRHVDGAVHRGLGRLHGPARAQRRRRDTPSGSSSATTRAPRRIYYQTSDQTWQAYNTYGGNSLYVCTVNCPHGPEALLHRPPARSPTTARWSTSGNAAEHVHVRRVSDGALPGAQRLRRQLHRPASTPTTRRAAR